MVLVTALQQDISLSLIFNSLTVLSLLLITCSINKGYPAMQVRYEIFAKNSIAILFLYDVVTVAQFSHVVYIWYVWWWFQRDDSFLHRNPILALLLLTSKDMFVPSFVLHFPFSGCSDDADVQPGPFRGVLRTFVYLLYQWLTWILSGIAVSYWQKFCADKITTY
jgi:hypothetical protein